MSIGSSIANGAIKLALPKINNRISEAIQQQGVDPYTVVTIFEQTLGEFKGASVKASGSLNNLTGLSSLEIESLEFTDGDFNILSDKDSTAKGKFTIRFKEALSLDVKGKVSASLLFFSESVDIKAILTNTGSTLNGEASFALGSLRKAEIKACEIDSLNWVAGESSIKFDGGLGVFNDFLDDFTETLTTKFNEELAGQISTMLKMAAQEAINAVLPVTLNG